MLSYSLISIVHAQFGTLPQPQQKIKNKVTNVSKQICTFLPSTR